ncbi:hypothetical protein QYM36_020122 [Artemia franciscana]|uniref:Methyltransferase FkbM domain-containing protein n=1 Tax=Artemia franciscana TaxID=6661 RepID=A0AA88H0E1_ARTSF|nr:hypothetical protein QYM36_020122 [Artemia franciscana]
MRVGFSGIVCDTKIYTGKGAVEISKPSQGTDAVLRLVENLRRFMNLKLFFDNFYTGIDLIHKVRVEYGIESFVNDAPGYVPKHNLRGMALKLRNLVTGEPVQAQCLPLYSILLAVNISVIDLMVLDSKSVEFEVLKTIPFQKIDIAVLLIEIYRKPKYQKEITHAYLKSQGYIYYDSFHNALYPGDDIFLNEKYLKKGVSLTNLSLSNYFKILTGKEKKEAPESEFESFENYFLPILV